MIEGRYNEVKPLRDAEESIVTLNSILLDALAAASQPAIDRGSIVRVSAFITNGMTYSIEGDVVRGSTRAQNVRDGVYVNREVKTTQIIYTFFLIVAGKARFLDYVKMNGITDGRMLAALFEHKMKAHVESLTVRRHIEVIHEQTRAS
jgi:hypothetical protein